MSAGGPERTGATGLAVEGFDVARVRADNPGPLTLTGTNTYVVGREPCWIVDPGPALPAHLEAVAAEVAARGGAGGIALTHDHADHVEGLSGLLERLGPIAVATTGELGPLWALPAPGHSPDSVVWLWNRVAFSGDTVLGQGSVFVAAQLREYLAALERLQTMDLDLLLPGHGEPVRDPAARVGELLAHRRDRERRLLEAVAAGARSGDALLDAAWSDAPPALRPAAALSMAAHLEKLAQEGRLPVDIERSALTPTPPSGWTQA
jgi:glyoxylase-like metal-dependent hydrolase (beta-lactamase superfamily II)